MTAGLLHEFRKFHIVGLELGQELGLQACGHELPQGFAVFIKSGLLVAEEVLQHDDVPFHFLYFRNIGHLTGAILDTFLMDDEVQGR